MRELYAHPTITTLHNLYGPSEDTTYSTHAITNPTDDRTPIGRPVHGTQALILDSELRPVPLGTIGELYLTGLGITRGYHNRPATTAERYLPNPHGPGRLYRTGDLARWRPDGQLDYVRKSLPEHMVPKQLVPLDELPLTPNGKVDRNALPTPTPAAATRHEPPSTPTEKLLGEIWTELLGHGEIGVHDDFFALGGHSLLASRMVSRVATRTGVALDLRLVFDRPTIAELARSLPELPEHTEQKPIPRLRRTLGRS